ncbi:MAG TPA: hypothetical protein VHB21_13840, partial [Minicystis sp.]|nr:hypothetical protein [Minicystis sp.]
VAAPPATAAAPPAAAPPAAAPHGSGVDTVFLKNGGRVRGHVMEDEPTKVSIRLVDGTTRVLIRGDVDHIDYDQ